MSFFKTVFQRIFNFFKCLFPCCCFDDESNKNNIVPKVSTSSEFERFGNFYRPRMNFNKPNPHQLVEITVFDVQSLGPDNPFERPQSATLMFRTQNHCRCDLEGLTGFQSNCVWFKPSCVCHQNPKVAIQKKSQLIIAKITSDFVVPIKTRTRHMFCDEKKPFTKDEAVAICQNLKNTDWNVVFRARPDEFWNCSCLTHPEIVKMPTNIVISHQPVETLYCSKENNTWIVSCLGRKHAIFVKGYDKQGHEGWFFDRDFIFETVFW